MSGAVRPNAAQRLHCLSGRMCAHCMYVALPRRVFVSACVGGPAVSVVLPLSQVGQRELGGVGRGSGTRRLLRRGLAARQRRASSGSDRRGGGSGEGGSASCNALPDSIRTADCLHSLSLSARWLCGCAERFSLFSRCRRRCCRRLSRQLLPPLALLVQLALVGVRHRLAVLRSE